MVRAPIPGAQPTYSHTIFLNIQYEYPIYLPAVHSV